MTPSRWDFDPRERAWLVWVKVSLRRRRLLRYSEWAVRTPSGMRLRVGWDPRFEAPTPTGHRGEP